MRKLVVAFVLLAGACSSGNPDQAENSAESTSVTAARTASTGSAACDILTKADAEKVLGRSANKLDATGGAAGLDICQYGYQGERVMDMGTASLTVHPNDLASMKQGVVNEGYKPEPVPGLGDEAFWTKESGLYVGKGSRTALYIVGIGGATDEENKAKAIELAKATVSRL